MERIAEGTDPMGDFTADDDAVWGLGLGCNGAIEVFIEPADRAAEVADALRAALEAEIGGPVMVMSGVSRQGVTEVLRALWTAIEPTRAPVAAPRTTWQP